MKNKQYPITFLDYIITVPMPGVIMFDEEINPDYLYVKDGDMFKVVINDGRIKFVGVSRKKD